MSQESTASTSPSSRRGLRVAVVLLAAIVATVIAVWVLGFASSGLSVPLRIDGDAAFAQATVKGLIEGGGMYSNPWLGAPGTQVTFDYPSADALNWLIVFVLARISGNAVVAVNLFYLLTFAFAAASAAYSALRLRVWSPAAFVVGVAFAMLPYHFYRSVMHLFLSNYWVAPLALLLAIELMYELDTSVLWTRGGRGLEARPRTVFVACLCVAIGLSGVYYAAFSCLVLAVAGCWGWRRFGRRNLYAALALIAVIGVAVVAQAVPGAIYHQREGRNPAAVDRGRVGGELYGFRLTQMLLPIPDNRLAPLRSVRQQYDKAMSDAGIAPTESTFSAALGMIGATGFVALFGLLLLTRSGANPVQRDWQGLLHRLSILGVVVFALGNVGGLGSAFAIAFPMIRAYGRISIFAGFLGLLVVGGFVSWVVQRVAGSWVRVVAIIGCGALLGLAVVDQVPAAIADRTEVLKEWDSLGAYVAQVESIVGPRAEVFQLPYVPFPENPPVERMVDYDHLKPYLRSQSVRWSYGAIKGRQDSEWQRQVATLDVQAMVRKLREAGFGGIWIDRFGYADSGSALIEEVTTTTGARPVPSENGRYAFFRL